METISMRKAVELCGKKPEWGAFVCKDLGGNYFWVNNQKFQPEDGGEWVAYSMGNLEPKYFNVEGLPQYSQGSEEPQLKNYEDFSELVKPVLSNINVDSWRNL